MDAPKVSVVVAVHNAGAFLRAALDSVAGQTLRDFEVVVIDDGSTDESPAVLAEFAARDARFRVVTQVNTGLTKTLNIALKLCRGELVARMDADDVCLPDRFEKQVAFLDAHPDVVLLGGAYELIDERDRRLHVIRPPADDATLQTHCLAGTTPICHPLAMFRRADALAVGGYDESFPVAQDLDFWLRLGERGKMAALPDVLLRYRMHPKSVSEKKQALQVECMRRGAENARARRGLPTGGFANKDGWRADGSAGSVLRQTLQYGWWAWNLGERRTAAAYGARAVRLAPLSADAWKLLVFGALRRKAAA